MASLLQFWIHPAVSGSSYRLRLSGCLGLTAGFRLPGCLCSIHILLGSCCVFSGLLNHIPGSLDIFICMFIFIYLLLGICIHLIGIIIEFFPHGHIPLFYL